MNHKEEYEGTRDGAITYFRKEDLDDNLIKMYGNSKDLNKKMRIVAIVKQKNENKEVFLNSMEEFEELREKIEKKSKYKKVETKDRAEDEKEIIVSENSTNDDSNDDNSKDNNLDKDMKELENKAKELEKIGTTLNSDLDSLNSLKNSLMSESVYLGVMLEARQAYEQAQDKINLTTAKYMVEKNILVAKREKIVLDINRAINRGEDVSSLSSLLVEVNNQVENLDASYNQEFPRLQAELSTAHQSLQNTSKEVVKKVSADFRNSYKQIQNYTEDGILQNESVDLTKNLNRVVMNTSYDASVLANGKASSIEAQTINIDGKVVRVLSQENASGVELSYNDGNTEQMKTGVGDVQYVTRDENGSLIADNPELEDSLKRIGVESVEDIAAACSEIDEKAEERDGEDIDEDMEFPGPVLKY